MSYKDRKETMLFLFVLNIYVYTFGVCNSINLRELKNAIGTFHDQASTRIEAEQDVQQERKTLGERFIHGYPRKSNRGGVSELRPQADAFPGKRFSYFHISNPDDIDLVLDSLSWTPGNVSTPQMPRHSHSEDGYQADFPGFHGVPGKVLAPSFDSSPHLSEWLAMRPLVHCGDDVMTFTASGEGSTQLLVDREGASPISLFQLPPYCGYNVRTSWSDLEMMATYDACYITQENGSYVLPMLWEGSQLKLSCPVQTPTPALSLIHPMVLCSPYGMVVQLQGREQDISMLGVLVNGLWDPFVSAKCAYRASLQPDELIFFISFSAPCIMIGDGLRLHLVFDEQEYILSCPEGHWFPYIPSPPSPPPSDPQVPNVPDPVSPSSSPPSPPQSPNQEQIAQLPDYLHYSYPEVQYPQIPQIYPPGPQPPRPPQPTPGSAPGPQPQQSIHISADTQILPVAPPQHPSSHYYYHPAVTPAPPTEPTGPPSTQTLPESPDPPLYYLEIPNYPAPPEAQAPTPLPPGPSSSPPSPPEQLQGPQYPANPVYLSIPYGSYHPNQQFFYPQPGLEVRHHSTPPPPSAPPPATTRTTFSKQPDIPDFPIGQMYPQVPIYLLPPSPPPAKGQDKPSPQEYQLATCPPYTHAICTYYHFPYYPYYYSLYPPLPQHPTTVSPVTTQTPTSTTTPTPTSTSSPTPTTTSTTTTSMTKSPPTKPTQQPTHLQCLTDRMVVFLPFAHPDSVQVRDQKTWLFLSTVSPLCGFMIHVSEDSRVILHSPLPPCYSQSRTPTAISLLLRFWDLSMEQYRTLDLHCPYQSASPTSVAPSVSPTPPSTTQSQTSPPVVPNPKVICSSHQMSVELPPGPISGIVVKDIKGNQMNLQDAPKHCGFAASEGKDGKIRLNLQLGSHCHMSVQGKMFIITIVYMTASGIKEVEFSCPVSTSGSAQECNLPREQQLPCGPGSVSQSHCLSMGCCFSKHPPACYYPMDECTIDRHFVFSVPASLTEPPLSPALLVVASDSTCKPEKVTSDYALFKIPMDGCGARTMEVGKTLIYMVEIINTVQAISLNYGTITRDSPIRLLVECRYVPGSALTVSYMVKTPTLGPAIHTQGVFGVQLRIAKDAQYSSYYPQYHQPLQMLLGKPLYLEVRLLNTPDPSLVLLVHYCLAYPRSGKAVWVLLYNGCPNPLDPAPQQAVLSDPRPPAPHAQTRRFTISTFQFLPDGEFKDQEEEIYFMCSTEICSPRDGPCVEGCFGQ